MYYLHGLKNYGQLKSVVFDICRDSNGDLIVRGVEV